MGWTPHKVRFALPGAFCQISTLRQPGAVAVMTLLLLTSHSDANESNGRQTHTHARCQECVFRFNHIREGDQEL